MNTALWLAQSLLAVLFLIAGAMKLTRPHENLTEQLGWPGDYSTGFVRFIGLVEVLGALGLVLPRLTGIRRSLPPCGNWLGLGAGRCNDRAHPLRGAEGEHRKRRAHRHRRLHGLG